MTTITKERVEELREWLMTNLQARVSNLSLTRHEAEIVRDIGTILDDYSAMRAENETLQRQVGIEQRKVADLDGLLAKYHEAAEKAEAEVEHRCDQRDAALESCSLVSAELERLKVQHHLVSNLLSGEMEERKRVKAQLAKQAPLVEVALHPDPTFIYQNNDLTRAALALREERNMSEPTKEQMINYLMRGMAARAIIDQREFTDEEAAAHNAILNLIESSGEKESILAKGGAFKELDAAIAESKKVAAPSPAPTDLTPTNAEMQEHYNRGEMNVPAPLPKEADVQKSIHLSKSVEEAMGRISEIMEDRIHSMQSHASVYGSDRESAQMRAEANTLAEDVAVIRAALAKGVEAERRYAELVEDVSRRTDQAKGDKSKVVGREWVYDTVVKHWPDCDFLRPARVADLIVAPMLRELGYEVQP